MQEEVTRARVLRCPCRQRMKASHDAALHTMLQEHIEQQQHHYADTRPEERVKAMVASAVYGFEYVPLGAQDGLEEEGFGPEPY